MTNSKIRVGVIGLGYLGKFHFEKYLLNKSINLTSIVDIDKKNLDSVNLENIYKSTSFKNIIEEVDAVSIVTPTITHFSIAKFFLENKVHVLLEKPMTESVSEARKLISIAKKIFNYDVHGFTIMNHDERYEEKDMVNYSVKSQELKHTSIAVEKNNFFENLNNIVNYHDSPVSTISYYAHWLPVSYTHLTLPTI